MYTNKILTPGEKETVFERCGLAALSDLETAEWKDLFGFLEKEQDAFLSKECLFRSPEYRWPRDPLHNWSRVWEYPYVYHHLKKYRSRFSGGDLPVVVDLGCGGTFFPFSVARLGFEVCCVDIDPVCILDLGRAREHVPCSPGRLNVQLISGEELPFADGSVDVIYCISVLEHIPGFAHTIEEMARVLKPGGMLLLTIDLDLRGDAEVGIETHGLLTEQLRQHFHNLAPDITIHPVDMLRSDSGPYNVRKSGVRKVRFLIKQWIIKPLLGRKPEPLLPFYLAVQAYTLVKK